MNREVIEKVQLDLAETCNNAFPRNIVEYCDSLNIKVKETDALSSNISGLIYKENDKYQILINSKQSIGRKAFTIAHELGHYFLHKDYLDKTEEIVSLSKGSYEELPALARACTIDPNDMEYKKMEVEANDFAANILMPKDEFLKQCQNLDSIDDVARYFGVSISAATIRADRVGGLYFL